jgi:hypothetical protein
MRRQTDSTDALASKSCEPFLESGHPFLECLLLQLLAGTCCLCSLLTVVETSANLRALVRRHLRPDPAGALDLVANAIVGADLLVGAGIFSRVADRHS